MTSPRFFYPALILLLLSSPLFSQGLATETVLKHGRHTEKYEDGSPQAAGRYKQGLRTGEWKFYDRKGRVTHVKNYSSGKLDGKYVETQHDSAYVVTGIYSNDKRKGKWTKRTLSKNKKEGLLLLEEEYDNGQLSGRRRVWHANGKLREESNYARGKLDGSYASWDTSGLRCVSGSYMAGAMQGEWKVYAGNWSEHELPQLLLSDMEDKEIDRARIQEYEGPVLVPKKMIYPLGAYVLCAIEYRGGGKHGWWRSYSPEGKLLKEIKYDNSTMSGPARRYNASGKPELEVTYASDVEQGPRRRWSATGDLVSEETLINGILHGSAWSSRSADGNPGYKGVYNYGEADSTWIFYYPDGTKMAEKSYRQSQPTGAYKEFDSRGNLIQQGQYAGGVPDGEWKTFYPSGAKRSVYTYKNGAITGWHRKWYESGQLMLEQVFPATKENPLPRVYDESGKELKPGTDEYANIAFELPGDYLVDISKVDPAVLKRQRESQIVSNDIVDHADVMPEFPGGQNAMQQYLARNIKYPQMEKESNIQGTVFVRFVVERDGSVKEAKILREPNGGKGLSKEALRVVKSMPRWKPARQGGRPVRCYMTIPVKFKLQ